MTSLDFSTCCGSTAAIPIFQGPVACHLEAAMTINIEWLYHGLIHYCGESIRIATLSVGPVLINDFAIIRASGKPARYEIYAQILDHGLLQAT